MAYVRCFAHELAMHYDVLIVGGRCAGASLAAFLARAGAKVLVIDKDRMPSDQVLSTHELHTSGMDVLDELGVGAAVRAVVPPNRSMRLRKGRAYIDVSFGSRPEYCPRRLRLDALLWDTAQASGAETVDATRLVSLRLDGARVSGARLECQGKEREVSASWVIGADGRRSRVARQVGAEEYLAYDSPRAMYWSYWEAPRGFGQTSAFGMYVGHRGAAVRVVFQTENDQLLIGSLPPLHDLPRWKADPLGTLTSDLMLDPEIEPLVAGKGPVEKLRGVVRERFFFRRAVGPGWALAGDAGLHKEWVTGDGISEALLQARSLSAALTHGNDSALERWWRQRDVAALPLYHFGKREGSLTEPSELEQVLFASIAARPEISARVAEVLERRRAPNQVVGAGHVLRVLAGGMISGNWQLWNDFKAVAKLEQEAARELTKRQSFL